SIIVVGNQAGIEKIRGLVAKLDFRLRPEDAGGVHVYYVRHGEAEKIANVLNGIASEAEKAARESGAGPGFTPPPGPPAPGPGFPGMTGDSSGAIFGGSVKVTADKDTNSLIITASRQ